MLINCDYSTVNCCNCGSGEEGGESAPGVEHELRFFRENMIEYYYRLEKREWRQFGMTGYGQGKGA
jgi:hypothetical protein